MNIDMTKFSDLAWQSGAILLILLVGFLCFQVVSRGLEGMRDRGLINQPVFLVVKNVMRWLLIIAVIAASFQQVGIKITNILTALVTIAGMIAIGFIAVWSILSNVLCSMMLIMFRNFDVGDEIEIVEPVGGSGLKGRVVGFNVMFTTLAESGDAVDAAMLTQIPNNIFFQKILRRKAGQKTEKLGQHLLAKPLKPGKNTEADSA